MTAQRPSPVVSGGGVVVSDPNAAGLRQFKPYPAYKESGVDWLGQMPARWEAKPLKYLTKFATGWTPPSGRDDLYGGEHLWANIGDLGPQILYETEKSITDAAIRETRMRIVSAGSLLFSFKLSVGIVSLAGVDMYSNEAIAAFAPSDQIDTGYLYWAAPVFVPHNAQDNIYGAPLLNRERIANARLLSPPLDQQRAIAAFLDRETARIDALTAKKERLIELLREKRSALITGTVTKGLDPNVPMKESGIEWVGEIPAHWKVIWLKQVASIRYGLGEPPQQLADGLPFIRATNVSKGRIIDQVMQFVDPNDVPWNRDPALRSDDIIVVRSGAYTGNSAIIPPEYDGAIAGYDMVVRPRRVKAKFLAWTLLSRFVLEAQIELESMRAAQPHLNAEELGAVLILLPPNSEQCAIAAFLDKETARIDALVTKVRAAIDCLTELRTALISAAVTGKIDVREEAA